ncbi:MAG: branched-chain amino acid ABC transporter permease [Rhodospirillaceae bacterium]|nr:branched-chain amino acid ABC transporter permease [Rhodospirillaceae bacterium]
MSGFIAYAVFFLTVASIYGLMALGLNLQWGFTGLFNVGVAGFFAVGAYTTAILTGPDYPSQLGGFDLPVPAGWLGSLLFSGLAALLVGVPTLRLRHDYLAIATFGIAIVIQLVALNFQALTGGALGLNFIPRPLAGRFADPLAYGLFYLAVVAAVLALAYAALERLVRGPWGRALKAIREEETAAAALGKNPAVFRLQAFVMGSMLMGLAGGLYASFFGFISPADFQPIVTFQLWTMLIVGGAGNNRGALLGAYLVWGLWSASSALRDALLPAALQVRGAALQIVLIGVVLALMLLFLPRGLIGEEAVVSRHARP